MVSTGRHSQSARSVRRIASPASTPPASPPPPLPLLVVYYFGAEQFPSSSSSFLELERAGWLAGCPMSLMKQAGLTLM